MAGHRTCRSGRKCLWSIYLKAGADVSVALGKVADAGGKVLHPKTFIKEGWGYFAIVLDTEGNSVGLQSPN